VVAGHFDYQKQALLYVAQDLPEPRSGAFTKAASEEVIRILEPAAAALSCSLPAINQMRMIYDRVSLEIDYPTFCCKAPARARRCSTSSSSTPHAYFSRRRRSGRAWMCRANN
jgi:hypothetical protein